MDYYNEIEIASRKEIEKLQLNRLKKMVDYCFNNVEFYRKRLSEVGITSGDQIKTLKDIERIPFTTKEDLQNSYPDGMLAVPKNKIARIHASSGTTGKPTVGYYTKKDVEVWADAAARVLVLNGLTEDDVFQVSVGYGLFTGALGFHQGAEKLGCTIIPASTGNTQKQLVMMRDMGVTVMMATPSYATYLSDLISKSDEKSEYKIRRVMLGAERCSQNMRDTIENNLGVVALDNYGLTEFFGPGVSGECSAKEGLHISEDLFYPEVINPASGDVLGEGERGELVFTSLLREGTPILRYRTRDISSLDYSKCKCGRTTVRMTAPFARTDEMFVFKGVNVYPSQIECALENVEGISPFYKILLSRENYQDNATLFVEVDNNNYTDEEKNTIIKKIECKLKEIIIVKINIQLVEYGTIERSEGKSVRVEDKRYSAKEVL